MIFTLLSVYPLKFVFLFRIFSFTHFLLKEKETLFLHPMAYLAYLREPQWVTFTVGVGKGESIGAEIVKPTRRTCSGPQSDDGIGKTQSA